MSPPHPPDAPARRQPAAVPVPVLQRRVRVALGQEPGDLVLAGGRVVNVFTERVEPANVVLADGWVAGVGPYDWPARQRLDLTGRVIIPGLIDAHMHVESTLLTPGELARLLAPHGTAAVVADPHEVGNVLGVPGILALLEASRGLPVDFHYLAPSCVPATSWEHAGAVLDAAAVGKLLDTPGVLGLAEVMDFPAVLAADEGILAKVLAAGRRGAAVDGHAPGVTGRALVAYAAAGVRSDHESSTAEEALQKAALGMLVQVREGSSARNLDALLPLAAAGRLGDWCLCTDDIHPDDLMSRGHLDGLLRRVVAGGVPAARAVRHATLVPARYYGLTDRGAVAPGYRADLAVIEDLKAFRVHLALKGGEVVACDGRCLAEPSRVKMPCDNTVRVGPLTESAFRLPLAGEQAPVISIVPGQLVTRRLSCPVARVDGHWAFDPERDVLLLASVERHRASGQVGLGLVQGFGLRRHGALGSSVAHDSHNLIVAGTNPRDMLACVRALEESGGGWVVACDGEVRALLPLPVAGLMSTETAETVCRGLDELHAVTRGLGCGLPYPFGTLSFLALPVIPELRVTDQGLFDVTRQEFVTF
jgi:adenine deaminase